MGQFTWQGYKWNTQERWGKVHPDRSYCWYDDNCVSVDEEGNLRLICKYSPAAVEHEGKTYYPKYGVGLVSSDKSNPRFKYGAYTWVAKLPKGKNLWPALWMWSFDSWPPEIDVVEAWTNCTGGYYRFPFKWNVTTNLHDPNAKYNMAERVGICKMPDPTENFIEYKLVWMPDFLDFYYNGKRIRTIDDPKLMRYLNENTKDGMNIIMNNHVTEKYCQKTVSEPLIVKSFSYNAY